MRLVSLALCFFVPGTLFQSLNDIYSSPKDALTLLFMGDTQYYFKCEPGNLPCKKVSKRCRENYGLDYYLRAPMHTNESMKIGQLECVKLENRYANRVQRQAIDKLIGRMRYPPAALIIEGDLTDFGHLEQMKEFKRGWLRSFPLPILAGLGNHDYENNINDCAFNFCAHMMLTWFTNYAKNMSIELDYQRRVQSAFDIAYKGSFAFSTRLCSITGKNCAHVIQLNNAIDYQTKFASFIVDWEIVSGMEYLKNQLEMLKDIDIPVLINMHQCEGTRMEKLKGLIADWIYETRIYGHKKRVAVLFAHMHSSHNVRTFCFHETTVPFVYVGSVTNNRFTFLSIQRNSTALYGLSSRDSLDFKDSVELEGVIDDLWHPCSRSEQTFVAFDDYKFGRSTQEMD